MSDYYLVERDDGSWTLNKATDGTEIGSWSEKPTESKIREAMVYGEFPADSKLPDAAKQAAGIGIAVSSDYHNIEDSHPRFPPW